MTTPKDAQTPEVDERPIPCIALTDFSYTADGRVVVDLEKDQRVDVAPQHYKGLVQAAMVEPAPGTDESAAWLAAEAALAEPVQDRLRRQREAEAPATKSKRAKPAAG